MLGVSGIGFGGKVWLRFGLLLVKIPPMLVMLGVGVVSMRGAPVALPSVATSQFKVFFDCGRAVRCLLPLGAGRFMHSCVLYGYQGADTNAEQLALTNQLFDAALGEVSVVVSLVYWSGISTWSPPKSLAWQKGSRLGSVLISRKLGLLLLDCILLLLVSVSGVQVVVIAGILFLVVFLLLPLLFFFVKFSLIGGLFLILLFVLFLTVADGSLRLRSLYRVPPLGLPLGCLLLIRARVPCLLRS